MKITILLLLVLLLLQMLFLAKVVNGVTDEDLNIAIYALISSGYNLFGNAIATSDLKDQILGGNNFTLFAPTDSSLYVLDMESTDIDYIQKLRYHVVISRLTMSDLQDLPSDGSYFETLTIPHRRSVLIAQDPMKGLRFFNGGSVTVNGIEISAPDLYIGSAITVHGLASILPVDEFPVAGVNDTSGDLGFLAPSVGPAGNVPPPFSSPEVMPVPDPVTSAVSPAPSSIRPASSPDMFPVTPMISPVPSLISPASPPDMFPMTPTMSPATIWIPPISPPATDSTAPGTSPAQVPIPSSENSPSPAPAPTERNINHKHGKHHQKHHHYHHIHRHHRHNRHQGSGRLLWSNQLFNLQC